MNEIDSLLVDVVARQIELDKPQRRLLKDVSPFGVTILGLVADPELLEAWYKNVPNRKDIKGLEAFVALMVLRDEVSDEIDDRLSEGDFDVLNDLVRLGVPWEHDLLGKALASEEHRFAATMCLLEIDDKDTLRAFIEASEDVRDVIRAIGLLGADMMLGDLLELRNEDDDEIKNGVDAAMLGLLEPSKYGKKLLAGEVDTGWLGDSVLVADAYQVTGSPSWLDVLGVLDAAEDTEAFEFAALLGTVAAAATWQSGGDPEATLDEPEDENDFMTNPKYSVAAGLVPDEELVKLAFEVALHEIRVINEAGSPGITGLPLTQTDPDDTTMALVVELLEAFDPAGDDAVARVEVVRTLCDAATWAVAEPDLIAPLEDLVTKMTSEKYPMAVRGAAQLMLSVLGNESDLDLGFALNTLTGDINMESLTKLAKGDDIKALCAMRHLMLSAEKDGIVALADAWRTGSVTRGDAFRVAIEEAILMMDEENNAA